MWKQLTLVVFVTTAMFGGLVAKAQAEVSELVVAQQYGFTQMPLMIAEHDKLIEKHLKAAGLGDTKVNWVKFAGAAAMNDAILSGRLNIANSGIPGLMSLWSKTKGNLNVKGIYATGGMPLYVNTVNPAVKSIKDFTEEDKIAVPAAKISIQAILLQMAAAKEFGKSNYAKLDRLTVTLANPDAQAALTSGQSEITTHVAAPPFNFEELYDSRVRTVLKSSDVVNGPITLVVIFTTSQFRDENPKTFAAFAAAIREAMAAIEHDKQYAAAIYVKMTKSKSTVDQIAKMLGHPDIEFTLAPRNVGAIADFMYDTGRIKDKPRSWKDLFFPEAHGLQGS